MGPGTTKKRPRSEDNLDALLDLMAAAQQGPKVMTEGNNKTKLKKKKKKKKEESRLHDSRVQHEGLEDMGDQDDDDDDSTYQLATSDQMSKSSLRSVVWRQDVKPPLAASVKGLVVIPPPPPIAMEVQRHDLVASLSVQFLNAVKSMNLDIKVVSFERWLLVQQQKAGPSNPDPLLPDLGGKKEPDQLLVAELLEAGASKKEAKRLANYLAKSSTRAVRQLQRQFPPGVTATNSSKGGRVTLHDEGDSYSVRWKSTSLRINKSHYDKLRVLYQRHRGGRGVEVDHSRFLESVFLVLARYDALAGGTDRGGGFQGALNNACFDVLLSRFDCRMECFASPLNSRYGRFCSAFLDTDGVFGSIGSFFDFHPLEGCFEANPPFVPYMMDRMAKHMEVLLAEAQSQGKPLCFIVVIPTWSPDKNTRAIQKSSRSSWERLEKSRFCVNHLVLKANEHGYCEGSQHRLPTRYKSSRFDTSVFFLQSPSARTKWPVTQEACEELRSAFWSRHNDETKERKGVGSNGVPSSSGGSVDAAPPHTTQEQTKFTTGVEKAKKGKDRTQLPLKKKFKTKE